MANFIELLGRIDWGLVLVVSVMVFGIGLAGFALAKRDMEDRDDG